MICKISNKGIAILKDSISEERQHKIKEDLKMTPFVPPNSLQTKAPFSIYRESSNKIYVPRFYAKNMLQYISTPLDYMNHFNVFHIQPDKCAFKGELRTYQQDIINTYMKESKNSGCGLLEIPCGRGKCLAKDTPILLFNGNVKLVQFITNNDILMGDDLKPRIVSGLHSGISQMYRIFQYNYGITYTVNSDHILTVYCKKTKRILDINVKHCLHNTNYMGIKINIQSKTITYTPLKIEKRNIDQYYGFTVNKNHRFLLGDGTVTHNTVMALNIVSRLKLKTLVIVHKEFLMNQWIERINQFLPNIKVGKIQGKVIQTEHCDIVLGMLQSLSMKEYHSSLFEQFGLTIVDECHHIGAEIFSRSLFKIVTPYMLGLSATMERKDKMSDMFRLFLGDVVYSEKPKTDGNVLVRTIFYENTDPEYSEVEYNFKGQVHYSRMIKKICDYTYRTELILRVLHDILEEVKQRQVMILAHNKSLLHTLFLSIKEKNIGSVGFYIGGMKEYELKETEHNQIILATYAMAEEALDIKTLSALILATPKSDVTQAAGRILRMKHEYPLIVDIVDIHDIFQRQWMKRKRYYKQCNYLIREIKSKSYHSDFNKWITTKCKSKSNTNKMLQIGKCIIDMI